MIDWLQTHLGMNPELQTKVLATVATIVGLWLLRRVVLGVVYRRVQDPWGRYRWRKGLTYVLVAVGGVIVGGLWFEGGGRPPFGVFGFLAAGRALALQEPLSNLAGWGVFLWRRPFEGGGRGEIG